MLMVLYIPVRRLNNSLARIRLILIGRIGHKSQQMTCVFMKKFTLFSFSSWFCADNLFGKEVKWEIQMEKKTEVH